MDVGRVGLGLLTKIFAVLFKQEFLVHYLSIIFNWWKNCIFVINVYRMYLLCLLI